MFDPSLIPLVQRLERDPDDQDTLEALWRALSDRAEHQTLALLAEKVALRRRTPAHVTELLHRAAELWARDLHRDDRAVPLWQKVLDIDPEHTLAMAGLAAAYMRTGRLEQAAALHRRILERVRDPRARLPILEAVANAYAQRGDLDGEIAALREAVALELPVALTLELRRRLARLLVQRSRNAQGESDDSHPDVREAARLLGSIAREGGTGRAQDFAAAALALWPGEEAAFQVAQNALSMRHAEVTTLRIRFLAANPSSRLASQVRSDLADGYLAAGRVDDAIAVLAAAVGEDAGATQRLARLYERTGRHRDLAQLLASMPLPSERPQRLALLRRRASAWRSANDRKAALAALRAVLDEAPADPEALAEVERDCRLRGDMGELRARLTAAAGDVSAPAAQRARWLREAAQLAEHAEAIDDAIALWTRAAETAEAADESTAADEAREAIVRLLRHEERWEQLLEHLARHAQMGTTPEQRRERWLRWVEVHRERHDDPAREAAVLEGLIANGDGDDRVLLQLIDAYRRAGNASAIEASYRTLIARSAPEQAAARWSQLAGHLEQQGNLAGALEAWRQARTLDPAQAMAWQAEERILEATGSREALLEVLIAHANHPVAAGRRAGELFARSAWLAHELGRYEDAARLAARALKFHPGEPKLLALAGSDGHDGPDQATVPPLDDALHDTTMPRDTGEFPAALLEADPGADGAGAITGEHTPAEGTRFDGLLPDGDDGDHGVPGDEPNEDTITRSLRALPSTPRITVTGEHPVLAPRVDEPSAVETSASDTSFDPVTHTAGTASHDVFSEPPERGALEDAPITGEHRVAPPDLPPDPLEATVEAVTLERPALHRSVDPPIEEEPTRPLSSVLGEGHPHPAERSTQPALPWLPTPPVSEPVSEDTVLTVEEVAEPVSEDTVLTVEAVAEPVSEDTVLAVEAVAEPVSEDTVLAVEEVAEPVSEDTVLAVEEVAEPVSEDTVLAVEADLSAFVEAVPPPSAAVSPPSHASGPEPDATPAPVSAPPANERSSVPPPRASVAHPSPPAMTKLPEEESLPSIIVEEGLLVEASVAPAAPPPGAPASIAQGPSAVPSLPLPPLAETGFVVQQPPAAPPSAPQPPPLAPLPATALTALTSPATASPPLAPPLAPVLPPLAPPLGSPWHAPVAPLPPLPMQGFVPASSPASLPPLPSQGFIPDQPQGGPPPLPSQGFIPDQPQGGPAPSYVGDPAHRAQQRPAPAPSYEGAPFTASTAPFTASAAPFTASGDPFTASAAPFTASGAPFTASGDPFTASGAPFTASGDPFTASGDPFAATAVPPVAFSAAPPRVFSAVTAGAVPPNVKTPPTPAQPTPLAAPRPAAPAPPPSAYQKTMASLFERMLAAQRNQPPRNEP